MSLLRAHHMFEVSLIRRSPYSNVGVSAALVTALLSVYSVCLSASSVSQWLSSFHHYCLELPPSWNLLCIAVFTWQRFPACWLGSNHCSARCRCLSFCYAYLASSHGPFVFLLQFAASGHPPAVASIFSPSALQWSSVCPYSVLMSTGM